MFGAWNPSANELILRPAEEVRTDNPSGRLYAETLGPAVAAQFLRTQLRVPRRAPGTERAPDWRPFVDFSTTSRITSPSRFGCATSR